MEKLKNITKKQFRILQNVFTGVAVLFIILWLFITLVPSINIWSDMPEDPELYVIFGTLFLNPFIIIAAVSGIAASQFYEQSLTDEEKAEREARLTKAKASYTPPSQPYVPPPQPTASPVTKETTIIKERVKVVYSIPDECPSCNAKISQKDIRWVGPLKAACPYCNSEVDVEEREI